MKKILDFWKKQTSRAINIQLTVILFIVYFIIMAPVGIWYKISQKIIKKGNEHSNWQDWPFPKSNEEIKQM